MSLRTFPVEPARIDEDYSLFLAVFFFVVFTLAVFFLEAVFFAVFFFEVFFFEAFFFFFFFGFPCRSRINCTAWATSRSLGSMSRGKLELVSIEETGW